MRFETTSYEEPRTETMPTMTLQQAIELANQHQQAGRLAAAEQLFREILAARPDCADARLPTPAVL